MCERPHLIKTGERFFFRPVRLEDAILFRARHPGAVIVAGATELGVPRNKQGLEPPAVLSLAGIGELAKITRDDGVLSVGANVTWAQLEAFAKGTSPEIHALTHRFGSPQIRNVATLVGNIAHGSPVADSLCFLMIVEAELELISMRGARRVAIDEFHTGPKQTVLAADEIITRVLIPLPAPGEIVKLYKISKRKEMDVSTFRAGIRLRRRGERIDSAAIAFCGVGPTVLRLPRTEAFLAGRPFSEATFREAGSARSGRGRADHRRPRVARVPPPTRREHPGQVLSRNYIGAEPAANGKAGLNSVSLDIRVTEPVIGRSSIPHESARAHVTGQAAYLDDIRGFATSFWSSSSAVPWPTRGSLLSTSREPARLRESRACSPRPTCRATTASARSSTTRSCWPRTSAIISASRSSSSPAKAARPFAPARAAIRLEVEPLPAVLSIDDAIAGGHFIGPTRRLARGDADAALEQAEHVIEGTFRTGGQEHFYLETQAALAIPGEAGQITVHSSTQNPSEIQAVVAHCLGLAPEHGRLHLHADGRRASAARNRRPPIPRCWRRWSPTRPAGRHASSIHETSTCG